MHEIEPFYNWRDQYTAEEDNQSPFYQRVYNEFAYDKQIYNFYIHPQWDDIESQGLFVKLLFADYEEQFCVIELFGEWNDGIDNDIMLLRRELIDPLLDQGITKLILIGENVLNFHGSDDSYYQDLSLEIEEQGGWIIGINFRDHVIDEMTKFDIPFYVQLREPFTEVKWRPYHPKDLFSNLELLFGKWLDDGILKLG